MACPVLGAGDAAVSKPVPSPETVYILLGEIGNKLISNKPVMPGSDMSSELK